MAPIWGGVAMNFVLTILLVATSHNIRIFKPSLWNCSDVLKFGMYSGGVSLINVFYNLSPQLSVLRRRNLVERLESVTVKNRQPLT